ncbi:MAG: pilus assembly protein [Actinomycetota bacterium]|nr:pilus assembly protein [Actinomycetota bacterium]
MLSVSERGSAPLETVFAIALMLFLVLGAIEVVWALYGRNVLMSSAHEGARAALELGRSPSDAVAIATRSIEQSTGALVDDLYVGVSTETLDDRSLVRVEVSGVIVPWGPVPVPIPVETAATVSRSADPGRG